MSDTEKIIKKEGSVEKVIKPPKSRMAPVQGPLHLMSVRMPVDLKDDIEKISDADRRSFHGTVIVLLEQAVKQQKKKRG